MLHLRLADEQNVELDESISRNERAPLHILCLGAHADDIEIGAAGTLLEFLRERRGSLVTWVIASASYERSQEARESAAALLDGLAIVDVRFLGQRDGYLDSSGIALKEALEEVRRLLPREPDLVLTHYRQDRHQDHRAVSDMTWNLWRDHLILEYEIPKWDGDLGTPNVFVPLEAVTVERKLTHLASQFASQQAKDWYDDETLRGLMRLRGMESRAPSRFAEAFYGRKLGLIV